LKIHRKNDLNLRLLEVFEAVMRCQTTIDAAEELGISQPAVSTSIKRFEKQVGFTLFDRTGRLMKPTEEARLLLNEVVPVFALLRNIEGEIAISDPPSPDGCGWLQHHHWDIPPCLTSFGTFWKKDPVSRSVMISGGSKPYWSLWRPVQLRSVLCSAWNTIATLRSFTWGRASWSASCPPGIRFVPSNS
jgi:hypothetical protein